MADLAFGEVGDEDAALIHDKGDAHFAANLADDVADDGGEEQLTALVLNGGDGLAHEAWLPAFVFVLPEVAEEGIVDLVHHPAAIGCVGQQAVQPEEGGVRAVHERGNGVVQDVFEAWPPAFMPDALEGTHNARGDEMSLVGRGLGEQIEPDGVVEVARVEIHGLLGAASRDVIEQLGCQIPMRINEADAVALLDELEDEIAQKRGLSRTRLADDVGVVACIAQIKTERLLAAPRLSHADVKIIFAHGCVHAAQASRRSRKEHE